MLAIIARYTFSDGDHAARFCEKAKAIVAPSRAEKGCNYYSFARDIQEDNVVWISEEWDSQEDLTAHLKADHIADFLAGLEGIQIVDEVSRQYEVSSVGPVQMPTE